MLRLPEYRLDPPPDDPEGPCVRCGTETTDNDGECFVCEPQCAVAS